MTRSARFPRPLVGLQGRIYGRPLLLLPAKAYELERVIQAYVDAPVQAFFDDDATAAATDSVDNSGYTVTPGGVALLPVMGTLVQRSSFMDSLSGLTSYASVGYALEQAQADTTVGGVLLEIDSPGGEVFGLFDLVDEIVASTKPVWAIANEAAYSAAYAIASAADRIFMPRTAGVGSIGVVMLHVDQSEKDRKQGVKYTPIFAGDKKVDGNSHEPLPDGVKASLQEYVDHMYQLFVSAVAGNRSLSADAVIATQADTFLPGDAISNGFADNVGTLDDAIATFERFLASDAIAASRASNTPAWRAGEMSASAQRLRASGQWLGADLIDPETGNSILSTAAAAATSIGVQMDPKDQAANPASNITPEALAAARTEAASDATKTATATAAAAERSRVASILASDEAKGRGALATHLATETDMSADAAIKLLAKSPKEAPIAAATNAFAAAMAGIDNPKLAADKGDEPGDASDPENIDAAVAAICAFQRRPASAAK